MHIGYLMKCVKKSSGKMSKNKKKNSLDIMKSKRWRVEKRRKEKKLQGYDSMVENENEEVGQHVLLAQVFLELY